MTFEWKKKAEAELTKTSIYCLEQFGKRTAEKFIDAIDKHVKQLVQFPERGFPEPLLADRRKKYRSVLVYEHFKLVYYYDERKDIIYIVDLWDTRREPQSLTRRIRGK